VAKTPGIPTLPPKEALILELLLEHTEMYGLELVAASKRRLKRGTVYVTLGRMEQKGLVTSRLEPSPARAGGLPRRLYEATPRGRALLAAWQQMAQRLIAEFAR
jgi:PadR family transcriptional regulator PadR